MDELTRVKDESKTEHETSAALMAEMDELSKSYEEMAGQNVRLLAQASERDKAISQLYSEVRHNTTHRHTTRHEHNASAVTRVS